MYPTKVWRNRRSFLVASACKAGPWFVLALVGVLVALSSTSNITGLEKGAGLAIAACAAIYGFVKVARVFTDWTFGVRFDMLTFRVMHGNDEQIRWCDLQKVTFRENADGLVSVICEFRSFAQPLTICGLDYDPFARSKLWDAFRRASLHFPFELIRMA